MRMLAEQGRRGCGDRGERAGERGPGHRDCTLVHTVYRACALRQLRLRCGARWQPWRRVARALAAPARLLCRMSRSARLPALHELPAPASPCGWAPAHRTPPPPPPSSSHSPAPPCPRPPPLCPLSA
eukprot:3347378-Rhodomonas_salina.1